MKKLLYLLFFFLPVVVSAQFNLYKDSPLYDWVNVGNAGFSAKEATYTSIAFSPSDGQPYVAYSDWGNSYKTTIMKFNGTNSYSCLQKTFNGSATCDRTNSTFLQVKNLRILSL